LRKPYALLLTVLLALVGCPDLSQVQQLGQTAGAGKSSLNAIAADFKGSCDRQNGYIQLPPGDVAPPPLPCDAKTAENYRKIGDNLIKEQAVLIAYFDALGKLAGTTTSGFDGVAPNLDTSFGNAGFDATQQEMAKAGGTIADAITQLATAGYREKKISEILTGTNDAVQKATTAMANIVDPDPEPSTGGGQNIASYMGILLNEDEMIRSYYEVPLKKEGSMSALGALFNLKYQDAVQAQNQRKEAARAYRQYMLALGDAHNKLAANAGKFEVDDVKKLSKELAKPFSDLAGAVRTLQKDAR
jgi:hypothetical protein